MIRRTIVAGALLGVLTACSQPGADDLPDGSVAVDPALGAAQLDVADDARFLSMTPRTPVGNIVDDAIRGARAAELVAAIGRHTPASYLPACTSGGDVIVVLTEDVSTDEVKQVLYDIVRGLDFLDITEPEELPRTAVADLTCAAEGRPLPAR